MTTLKFGGFEFNTASLRLRHNGSSKDARSQQLVLLSALLEKRHRVVSKQELIQAVWKADWVSDQNLFQAMSDLRSLLAPLKPIRTFANRGYQWIEPVIECEESDRGLSVASRSVLITPLRLAAVVTFIAVAGSLSFSGEIDHPDSHKIASRLPHAMSAFNAGLDAFRSSHLDRAEQLFQQSLDENPQFLEARLLQLEIQLEQGRHQQAIDGALSLLNRADNSQDAYSMVLALEIASRGYEKMNLIPEALSYAGEALQHAREEGFSCTAAALSGRVSVLAAAQELNERSGSLLAASPIEPALVPEHCDLPQTPAQGALDRLDGAPGLVQIAYRAEKITV